jgi:hypothetical protein
MESKSSKKWSGVFLVLVGAALFLFGYYLGLPQPLIDNNEIASEELPQKPSVELQSKNIKPSTKSSDRDREVQENEEEVEEEEKKLASQNPLSKCYCLLNRKPTPLSVRLRLLVLLRI